MKKFLENKKLLMTFVTVLLILVVLAGSVSLRKKRTTPLLIQSFGNDVASIAANVVNVPVSLLSGGATNVHELLQVQAENNRLKRQIDDLGQTKARNAALVAENSQLQAALKLNGTLSGYTTINASVISRSPDTWSDLLIINKGSASGIAKNMAVMSGGGVIGRVLEANAATSKVELITTTDQSANRFAVEADAKAGQKVHGIISANTNNSLSFTQVVDSAKLTKGTEVYTSGLGGNSPKGLLVGKVAVTTKDSYGLSDVVKIKPAGNVSDASVVTVIKRRVAN